MCGIVAIHAPNTRVSGERLECAVRELGHRGPDGTAQWLAGHGRIGLGHARLSIVDLADGTQPIANEDGTIRAVTNGEFYGYNRIRISLEAKRGHRFRSRSDAEILPHLYEESGVDCLEHLSGEFAFVLWDEKKSCVFAARDRFGIKPIYYATIGETIYIASEVKSLFAAGLPARWDLESVSQQLFACLGSNRTLFKDVFQIPPGHYLLSTHDGIKLFRYWDLDYPVEMEYSNEPKEPQAIEGLHDLLESAVVNRLDADVPVACFLSGGIDSSTICGFASKHGTRLMRAFTVAYADDAYNEAGVASDSAIHCGVPHDIMSISGADYANNLVQSVCHAETFAFNLHGVARYLQCKRVHESGYKTILSGEGADEILGGYGFSRFDIQPGAGQYAGGQGTGSESMLAGVAARLGFVPGWIRKLALERSVFQLVLDDDFSQVFCGVDVYDKFLDQFDLSGQLAGRAPLFKSLYLWARSMLPNYILAAERLEMAHAVEVRLPYLDHRLFEFVRYFSGDLLMRSRQEKYVLREAARGVVTNTVYKRPKQPFTAPPEATTPASATNELIQDYIRGTVMKSVPFFSSTDAISYLDSTRMASPAMQASRESVLLAMTSACILQERYGLT